MHYDAEERVRLEILAYPNPEGLHPIEEAWRDLARKLKEHVEELTLHLTLHHNSTKWGNTAGPSIGKATCKICEVNNYIHHNFPKAFTPNALTTKTS